MNLSDWWFDRRQRIILKKRINREKRLEKKRKRKDKREKYINELKAYIKNNKYYDTFKDYSVDLVLNTLMLASVVFAYTHRNPIMLGFGIAVTIHLAQHYIEWWFMTRKKYR